MLNRANTLHNYVLESLDGPIGEVKDFYFDDQLLDDSLSCRRNRKLAHGQTGVDFSACAGCRE